MERNGTEQNVKNSDLYWGKMMRVDDVVCSEFRKIPLAASLALHVLMVTLFLPLRLLSNIFAGYKILFLQY
jgi:hypothetical protein